MPYGTSYWQVGDSSEKNGTLKMLLTEPKELLMAFLAKRGRPMRMCKEYVIPLIINAWPKCFGNERTNKKAIAEHGWGALNWVLLNHPEGHQLTEQEER